jgi:hypothetical protein
MPVGRVVNSVKDILAVVIGIIESAKDEVVFLTPPSLLCLAGTYGSMQSAKVFIQNGGVIRGIVPISCNNIERARMQLDIGEDLRLSDRIQEVFMLLGDKQQSISAINIGVGEYTLETSITAFWSESPTYAEYLYTSFENAWSEAVPARERIKELLTQG